MKKNILFLIALLCCVNVFGISPEESGLKLFNDWSPDNEGKVDVTEKLQAAVNWCIENNRTLYLGSGTYLVSDKIIGEAFPGVNCGNQDGRGSVNIYGDAENPPVIRLVDFCPGFGNNRLTGRKAVFEIKQAERNAPNCLFWSTVRNICFDMGKGNSGAVAMSFDAAQDCELSNIKVYGQGEYACGFEGIPGRNAIVNNLEVLGGKYAFYLSETSTGFSMSGIRCFFQSEAAVFFNSGRAGTIVGLEVAGCGGPAVITKGNGNAQSANLVLYDARIDISDSTCYAFNLNDRAVLLHNVYVRGTPKIIKGNSKSWEKEDYKNWLYMDTYAYTPEVINKVNAWSKVEGIKSSSQEIKIAEEMDHVPGGLVYQHIQNRLLDFCNSDVLNLLDYGAIANDGRDDWEALEIAMEQGNNIFIPSGNYHFSQPVHLKEGVVIFGDPGKKTHLCPLYDPSDLVWLISTPDGEGWNGIQDLALDNPDESYYGGVLWQTRSGYIYNVRNYLSSGHLELNKQNYTFTGNAGGSFFGISEHNNFALWKVSEDEVPAAHPDFRKVYIKDTRNPITFYGLNLERGGSARPEVRQYPFFEAINSGNIRVFGSKTETDGTVFRLEKVKNFLLSSFISTSRSNGISPILLDQQCKDIEMAMVYVPDEAGILIADSSEESLFKDEFLGFYSKGTFNKEIFDAAESVGFEVDAGEDICIDGTFQGVELRATVRGNPDIHSVKWEKVSGPACRYCSEDSMNYYVEANHSGDYIFRFSLKTKEGIIRDDYVKLRLSDPSSVFSNEGKRKLIVSCYPNPAREFITLVLSEPAYIKAYNYEGQIVYEEKQAISKAKVNISDFDPGIYVACVNTCRYGETIRFIKL